MFFFIGLFEWIFSYQEGYRLQEVTEFLEVGVFREGLYRQRQVQKVYSFIFVQIKCDWLVLMMLCQGYLMLCFIVYYRFRFWSYVLNIFKVVFVYSLSQKYIRSKLEIFYFFIELYG